MAIFFIDSMAHYTTNAQLLTKWAGSSSATVVAGTGAFGTPGSAAQGNQGLRANFTALITLEASFYAKFTIGAISAVGKCVGFRSALGEQCSLWISNDGSFLFYRGNQDALLGQSAANSISFNVHHHLYIKVVFSQTVGTIDIRVDGVSVLSLTGLDNCAQVATDCSIFGLTGDGVGTGTAANATGVYSHFALANASGDITGQPRVEAVFPDGVGATTAWTTLVGAATHWEAVDETTPDDDTSYIASATVGQVDTFTYGNLLSTAATVLAVAVNPRARKDDAAARDIASVVRMAATDYVGATKAVPGSYGYLQDIWATNPNTAAAWTVANVNAIEAGVKVIT